MSSFRVDFSTLYFFFFFLFFLSPCWVLSFFSISSFSEHRDGERDGDSAGLTRRGGHGDAGLVGAICWARREEDGIAGDLTAATVVFGSKNITGSMDSMMAAVEMCGREAPSLLGFDGADWCAR